MNKVIILFVIGILFLPEIAFGMTSTTTCNVFGAEAFADYIDQTIFFVDGPYYLAGTFFESGLPSTLNNMGLECVTETDPEVRYGDWLFVSIVLIFLLSFLTWGYFFSLSKTRHDSH